MRQGIGRFGLGIMSGAALSGPLNAQTYVITEIPPVQDNQNVSADGINAFGAVVGTSSNAAGQNFWGFVYQPGIGSSRIGRFFANDPQPSGSYGRCINSLGLIGGGSAQFSFGAQMAMTTTVSSPLVLHPLGRFAGGGDSDVWGINDASVAVGFGNHGSGGGMFTASNPGDACRWIGGTMEAIPTLGGYANVAMDINGPGDIVGIDAFLPNPNFRNTKAFLLPNGASSATELAIPFGRTEGSRAFRIKDSGIILGMADDASGVSKPVMWVTPSVPTVLGTVPNRPHSYAFDALNSGRIAVGTAWLEAWGFEAISPKPLGGTAVLYVAGVGLDLNTLITPGQGWNLRLATGINESGTICGTGDLGPLHRAFVLTPCGPLIVNQPSDGIACATGSTTLSVESVSPVNGEPAPASHQWQVESPANSGVYVDLFDGTFFEPATGLSVTANGVASSSLEIADINLGTHANLLRFRVRLENGCGNGVTSRAAALTVCGGCVGDVDCDCTVSLGDLAILLSHFGMQSGATRADGDMDADGDIDLTDLTLLLSAFGSACV